MLQRLSFLFLIPALLFSSCAEVQSPLASPEDLAIKQKLIEALGEYNRTLNVTISGGRVYFEGELKNFEELQRAMSIARDIPGVTSIVEEPVYLTEVGNMGDGSKDR